jgi:hypothetical protein
MRQDEKAMKDRFALLADHDHGYMVPDMVPGSVVLSDSARVMRLVLPFGLRDGLT